MIYLKTSIGVELRGEDLLICSLQSNFSGGAFTHFKRIPNYQLRNKDEVRKEIDFFFKSTRLSKDNIILGIPRRDYIVRHIDLPAEVADNLKQVVQYQVQSFEPTEEDKLNYDYTVLESDSAKKKITVLLVMIRKSLLDSHLQKLQRFGIRPVAVTGGSIALSNIFLQNRKDVKDKTYFLADLSPLGMELVALRSGNLVYSREATKDESQSWNSLFLDEIDEAIGKIRLGPNDTIEKIVLTGEQSERAQQEIASDIPDCALMKNVIRFDMPPENEARFQEAAAVLGLAYTGAMLRPPLKLNLLPDELRAHQARWAYIPAIILGIAIIALLIALGLRSIVQDQQMNKKLAEEIQMLQPQVNAVKAIQSQTDKYEKRIIFIEDLLRKQDMNLEVLQELTAILPPDTYLGVFNNRGGTILISGSSGSAPDLIPRLERSPLLKDVVQKGTIFKDSQTGKDKFSFEAKLER
jgi:Tfp pilus assembly protein PilN